ncbi:MAG: AAA family ATPase [Chloroflexota bacterium]
MVRVVALAAVAAAGVVAYRPDLRAVVSKYIGETEKSLRALFNRTERSDTRLAFDEGDALFERRDDSDD